MKIKNGPASSNGSNLVGQILSCARKAKNLALKDVAWFLDMSQSTYSNLEKGRMAISLFQWKQASDLLNIPLDALSLGYIDFESSVSQNSPVVDGFNLPRKYSSARNIKVRKFLPLFEYIKEYFGEDVFFSVITSLDFEPDFFRLVDNQVNLAFINDLLDFLWKGRDPVDLLPEISWFMKRPQHQGVIWREMTSKEQPKERIKSYLSQSNKYHTLFSYRLSKESEKSVTLNVSPNFCLKTYTDEYSPTTLAFLEKYRETFIESICSFETTKSVLINETASIYWDDFETVYEIKF